MMTRFKMAILAGVVALIIAGCGDKQDSELFNLTPDEWYSQILKDIQNADLDAADTHYISFSSEHIATPLLEQILLILAEAHVNEENYKLVNFYLDEYMKRYGNSANTELGYYLKIKANYDSFSRPNRNQKLMDDSIAEIEQFLMAYPMTKYRPLIETMLTKLKLAKYHLDKEIYELYKRTGKENATQIYKERLESSPLHNIDYIEAKLPWYIKPFE